MAKSQLVSLSTCDFQTSFIVDEWMMISRISQHFPSLIHATSMQHPCHIQWMNAERMIAWMKACLNEWNAYLFARACLNWMNGFSNPIWFHCQASFPVMDALVSKCCCIICIICTSLVNALFGLHLGNGNDNGNDVLPPLLLLELLVHDDFDLHVVANAWIPLHPPVHVQLGFGFLDAFAILLRVDEKIQARWKCTLTMIDQFP